MSSAAAHNFATPSQDFITLCQSQITLLTQGLNADWSAIYLTQESQESTQTHLIPIVFYPPKEEIWTSKTTEQTLYNSEKSLDYSLGLPIAKFPKIPQSLGIDVELDRAMINDDRTKPTSREQLVLPLIHKEIVVGFLVTGRNDRQWQRSELKQLETIAQTLAIARLLDCRSQWYQEQLSQQQRLQCQERDRLDDLFHQLRNPLTALRIFSKLLLKRLRSDEKSLAIIENIVRESDHLQELLQEFEVNQEGIPVKDDLVTFDTQATPSLPPGKPLPLSSLCVKEVLEPLLISAQSMAQEKKIELKADLSQNLPCVWANAQALREVFSNLIDNALKYTPSGGQVSVQVGLLSMIDHKIYQGIAIEDTGYGIPLEDQAHIFERHYRGVQGEGEIAGSGLGLAIAKDLVTQMQGIIELVSPTDKPQKTGTRFLVWLPLANRE